MCVKGAIKGRNERDSEMTFFASQTATAHGANEVATYVFKIVQHSLQDGERQAGIGADENGTANTKTVSLAIELAARP